MLAKIKDVTGYNFRTIFPGTIFDTQTWLAHENNFAVRADDFNFFRGRRGGLLNLNRLNLRDNFFVEDTAIDCAEIRQAVELVNFVHADTSFVYAQRRSFIFARTFQRNFGRRNFRRGDKFTLDTFDNVGKPFDFHDFADTINRRSRKTFVAAENNRHTRSRICNDDDDSTAIYTDAYWRAW